METRRKGLDWSEEMEHPLTIQGPVSTRMVPAWRAVGSRGILNRC